MLSVPVIADEKEHVIQVNGEGVVNAAPDELLVSLTVQARADKVQAAVSQQAQKMQALLAFLKKSGVEDKAVSTSSYWYGAEYDYQNNKQVLKGFASRQQLQVRLPLAKGGAVLEGIAAYGTVDGTTFAVSNLKELQEQAVNLAIDDAQSRAKRRAEKLGVRLGSVLGFNESGSAPARPRFEKAMRASAMADAAPELPAGEAEIHMSVSVTYELLPIGK